MHTESLKSDKLEEERGLYILNNIKPYMTMLKSSLHKRKYHMKLILLLSSFELAIESEF